MDIIYCAGGNSRLAAIAIEEGFLYGARSDDIRSLRCDGIIDINWKDYDWKKHLAIVADHKPKYAVVPDIVDSREVPRTLRLAEQLALYTRSIIVPKVPNIVQFIPRIHIIGVSVPTTYAGFLPDVSELEGRSVHLLGGSPKQQRELWCIYKKMNIEVTSVDLNSHSKASDFGSYWDGDRWCDSERHSIGKYKAFRKSCRGIIKMWGSLGVI
jgi:hypothetical protein